MQVTVAICTWNRCELLQQTLEQMRKLQVPNGVEWELLIVNNNCTDNTDEVLATYAQVLPIRRLFEPKPGLSNARNCTISAVIGELLIWTDDDVLVDPNWLSEYVKAANDWPQATFFGGTTDPLFEVDPPKWMTPYLDDIIKDIFAIRQYGDTVHTMLAHQLPVGANMAVRTDVMRQFRFDSKLGRVKDTLTSGDESDFMHRLIRLGHLGVWVGTARVRHVISASRLTKVYLRNFYRGQGRTTVRVGDIAEGPAYWGIPRWAIRCYGEELIKSFFFRSVRSERWFESFRLACRMRGVIEELCARQRLGRKRSQTLSDIG